MDFFYDAVAFALMAVILFSPTILLAVTAKFSRRRLIMISAVLIALLTLLAISVVMLTMIGIGSATSPSSRSGDIFGLICFVINMAAWLWYLTWLPAALKRAATYWEGRG